MVPDYSIDVRQSSGFGGGAGSRFLNHLERSDRMISRCKSCCGTIRSVAASGIYEISYRTYGKLLAVRELALIAGNGSCSVGIHNAGQSRVAARDDIGARCCDSAGDKIRRTVGIRIREFLPVYDLERIVGCFEVGSSRPSQSADRNIPAGQRIRGVGDLLGKRDVECNRLLLFSDDVLVTVHVPSHAWYSGDIGSP